MRFFISLLLCSFALASSAGAADPLPSWNDTAAKRTIVAFVERTTDASSPDFVPAADRIATFDNDGTLWAEQPLYFQAYFAFDRVREMAKKDPALLTRQPFKSVLENDVTGLAAQGEHGLAELIAATHSGMTVDEFNAIATSWLANAKHPKLDRLFTDLVYQPQLELLAYLRSNGFKTFIVSGGGVEFIRAFAERTYSIPPEQVIGSSVKTKFELRDGKAVLVKLPELGSNDDKEGKPININLQIGRRPILAFGNSDGDRQMLEYTASGSGARLMLLLHHDDAAREFAYDRESRIGRLDKALDEANAEGWTVVSMKSDWNAIFPAGK